MAILTIIGIILLIYAISFGITAGLVWLITWGLVKIGITTLFGWTVAFSWPLVIVVSAVIAILKGIFSVTVKKGE